MAQFEKCVKAGACDDTTYAAASADKYCNYNRGDKFSDHPMNCINFEGAKQYCKWIGGRLPTEEEWEYAATHNGKEHLNVPYPWGSDEPVRCKTGNYLNDRVQPCRGEDNTSSVGTYSPEGDSPLGLKDLVGNVCEITASPWDQKDDAVAVKGCPWEEAPGDLEVSNRLKQSRSIISTTVSYETQNTGGKLFRKKTETIRSVKKTTSSIAIIRNTGFRCAK